LKTSVLIAAYFVIIGVSGFYLLLTYWYVWVALGVGGLVLLVSWHAKATAYHCPVCGHDFEISVVTDLLSPHGVDREGGWLYPKCPNCSLSSRMKTLIKAKETSLTC
jgi:hypothetical protein